MSLFLRKEEKELLRLAKERTKWEIARHRIEIAGIASKSFDEIEKQKIPEIEKDLTLKKLSLLFKKVIDESFKENERD